MQAYRTACRELGFLTKGSFTSIPKKGSPDHAKIMERAKEIASRQGQQCSGLSETPEMYGIITKPDGSSYSVDSGVVDQMLAIATRPDMMKIALSHHGSNKSKIIDDIYSVAKKTSF